MIIRRRRNSGFTIVGNGVLDDERLSYEAAGLLVYLISRPDHWEVRPSQLAERRAIGRDRMRRMLGELIDAGYILREKERDEKTGAFVGDTYIVFDEPQKADPESVHPAPENPSLASDGLPSAGKSVAGLYRDSARTEDSTRTEERSAGAREEESGQDDVGETIDELFERACRSWRNMALSKRSLAMAAFQRVPPTERKEAVDKIPAFHAFLDETSPKQARPFLHNYFEDFRWRDLPKPRSAPDAQKPSAEVREEIPAWGKAWWHAWHKNRKPNRAFAVLMVSNAQRGRGLHVSPAEAEKLNREAAAYVAVPTSGPEMKAWSSYLSSQGIFDWPRPDRAEWVFMPSRWPPDTSTEPAQHALAKI